MTLLSTDTFLCFTYPAIIDNFVALEPERSFSLTINETSTVPNDPRIVMDIDQADIIIIDDDGMQKSCRKSMPFIVCFILKH